MPKLLRGGKTSPRDVVSEQVEEQSVNQEEVDALKKSAPTSEELTHGVSSERLDKVAQVVQEHFNRTNKHFAVNGFKDKGSSCIISMSNDDFDLTVVVKDPLKFGIE